MKGVTVYMYVLLSDVEGCKEMSGIDSELNDS